MPTRAPGVDGALALLATPPVDQLLWGVHVVDARSGEVLVDHGGRRRFIPASNVKLLVGAAALSRFGPDHRFLTTLHADRAPDPPTGHLDADLIVAATGDPTLSERFWPDDRGPLAAIADSLRAAGVREVGGRLVVDVSAWDSATVAGTWMLDNLPWYHSAAGGAFAVAEGETRVTLAGGRAPGAPVGVSWRPLGRDGFVVADVATGPDTLPPDLAVGWLPESRRIVLAGTVPADSSVTLRLSTRDPVREAAAALHRTLEEAGIPVEKGWAVRWPPAAEEGVARHGGAEGATLVRLASPPLIEVVEGILGPSQNWMSEQVARSLGASDTTRAGWRTGLRAIERILVEEVGVDSADVVLHDGSGMSAYNVATPRSLVRVLRWALEQPWGEAWMRALAEPGEEGSTLEDRLLRMEGRLWAKTGTISNVNALSGYLRARNGRLLAFSVLTNGSGLPARVVRDAIDELVWRVGGG